MIVPNTGIPERNQSAYSTPSSVADVLFSPVQQRVLALLFGQPQRKYQSGEIIRLAGSGTGAVHRLLTRLAAADLLTVEKVGNQKHYQANTSSPVFEELAGLVRKTIGLRVPLKAALAPFEARITAAFVYGCIAKGRENAGSDIDLMVLADNLDYSELFAALPAVEGALGRPVNPNLMTRTEWRRKSGAPDSFAARIALQQKLFILGGDDDLD
jgi:predicted nucleotidyltransferase